MSLCGKGSLEMRMGQRTARVHMPVFEAGRSPKQA